jgi:RNA polymerase sigma factor (sigma-70 family)
MEVEEKNEHLSHKAQADYDLVLKAVNDDDQQAYTELMGRYRNSIFHMMLKMVNNRDDADDLTLEAFGKAFKKLPSYAPKYAFSTWLFKIAINNCIDHLRKKKLNLLSIDDPIDGKGGNDFSNNLKSSVLDPEEEFIQKQKVKLMRNVLGRLNPKYKLMIELRFFEELSYDDIAKELGIPLGTVKAQLFRAKEILYNLLQDSNPKAYLDMKKRKKK